MKSVERRHKSLTHATPHKLRHTGATLTKQSGTSLEAISEALTHSDTLTTKTISILQMSYQWLLAKLHIAILKSNGVNLV